MLYKVDISFNKVHNITLGAAAYCYVVTYKLLMSFLVFKNNDKTVD